MKKFLKKVAIFSLMMILITSCGEKKSENKPSGDINNTEDLSFKANTSEDVLKNQVFDGLDFTDTSLIYENGSSTFMVNVTNNTGADYTVRIFEITVKDKNDEEMATLVGYVGDVIKIGETRTITSSIDIDLTKARSIEYSVKKI